MNWMAGKALHTAPLTATTVLLGLKTIKKYKDKRTDPR